MSWFRRRFLKTCSTKYLKNNVYCFFLIFAGLFHVWVGYSERYLIYYCIIYWIYKLPRQIFCTHVLSFLIIEICFLFKKHPYICTKISLMQITFWHFLLNFIAWRISLFKEHRFLAWPKHTSNGIKSSVREKCLVNVHLPVINRIVRIIITFIAIL